MKKTRFSVIGCGYFVKVFAKDHPLYVALKERNITSPHEYITDFDIFKSLGLKDNKGVPYNSFYEVCATETFPAYAIDAFTRLEIKPDEEKRMKVMFKDLERTDYLFPPDFKIEYVPIKNEGLIVAEYDKGNFGTTVHPTEFQRTDILSFEIVQIPGVNTKCIRTIKVNQDVVALKRPDTLNFGLDIFMA